MSVKNLFFARPSAKLPSPTAIFNNWQWKMASRCSPSLIIAVVHTSDLLFLPKVKSEVASYLLAQGTFKKIMQGVTTIATEELTAAVL
jgi:hypothetical protein